MFSHNQLDCTSLTLIYKTLTFTTVTSGPLTLKLIVTTQQLLLALMIHNYGLLLTIATTTSQQHNDNEAIHSLNRGSLIETGSSLRLGLTSATGSGEAAEME